MAQSVRLAYAAKQAWALKPGNRDHKDIYIEQYVCFHREKKAWSVPCKMVAVYSNIVKVMHNASQKTASRNSVMTFGLPFILLLNPEFYDLDFEGYGEVCSNKVAKPSTNES
jgi:hypothetical protein